MTTTDKRQKLVDYLNIADDKKINAIYTMVEDEINTQANDWDDDFIEELEKRSKSYKNGTANTFTWENTKQAAIKRVKEKRG